MQNSIIWDKCVLCQKDSAELLQCPAKSSRKDVGAGYKTLAGTFEKNCQNDSIPQCLYSLLGLSVSYDRVLSISTDIRNTICRKFQDENLVCPAKLWKGILTTSAVDNIDHNPSSNTAKGPFHGTGISLFQNVSREYPGIEQEQISLEHRSKLDTKKVCELPDWYTDVPPCILRDANAHTTNNVTLRTDEDYLSIALQDEIVAAASKTRCGGRDASRR
ncbi:Hypothetical predicted protein [Paramuricea clavata]|uniref:Uncharacterized protein n=1 Tax=Paramuricea clavata TaxID=317549 RepID=A0A7D9E5P4_PARCT|nr:Hypothetical predicted protein [Paramuricea clavata]